MKYWVIHFPALPATGMTIFPFILVKEAHVKKDKVIINHEKIHLRQQLELLIIPFYLLYLLFYLVNIFRFKSHHDAYANIVFEREAYQKERDLDYLSKRKFWSWIYFF